jgi:hypothetical protein
VKYGKIRWRDPDRHAQLGQGHLGGQDHRHPGPGKFADMIAVAGDPLKDISVLSEREKIAWS